MKNWDALSLTLLHKTTPVSNVLPEFPEPWAARRFRTSVPTDRRSRTPSSPCVCIDLNSLKVSDLSPAKCGFSYRRSIFNSTQRGRYIVTRVDYALKKDGPPRLTYADLRKHFAGRSEPSLAEVSSAVRSIRHQKGMLIVDGDPDCRSAGSFFKNPVIGAQHHVTHRGYFAGRVPSYPAGEGFVKMPAAWLVGAGRLSQGLCVGARRNLQPPHPGPRQPWRSEGRDILALRDRIVIAVEQKFSIRLEPEPVFLGPESHR